MEQEIINKAKEMLTNADTSTNDCKHYNNGFMDGVEYAIKALRQLTVSGSYSAEDMSKAWIEGYHRKVDEINGNELRYFDVWLANYC